MLDTDKHVQGDPLVSCNRATVTSKTLPTNKVQREVNRLQPAGS